MEERKRYEDGFTMVEMIITIAISAILVGTIATAFGYLAAGNTKRSAARFNSQLSTAQTETMMEEKPTYLYLYADGGVKAVLSKEDYTTYASPLLQLKNDVSAGKVRNTDVGGAMVDVTLSPDDGGTAQALDASTGGLLRISFVKATGAYHATELITSGGADASKFFEEIQFSGREKYKVTLVKSTGKHVMSK